MKLTLLKILFYNDFNPFSKFLKKKEKIVCNPNERNESLVNSKHPFKNFRMDENQLMDENSCLLKKIKYFFLINPMWLNFILIK